MSYSYRHAASSEVDLQRKIMLSPPYGPKIFTPTGEPASTPHAHRNLHRNQDKLANTPLQGFPATLFMARCEFGHGTFLFRSPMAGKFLVAGNGVKHRLGEVIPEQSPPQSPPKTSCLVSMLASPVVTKIRHLVNGS
jgi:hypothetical protein